MSEEEEGDCGGSDPLESLSELKGIILHELSSASLARQLFDSALFSFLNQRQEVLAAITALPGAPHGMHQALNLQIDTISLVNAITEQGHERSHPSVTLPDLFWSTVALALLRKQVTGPTSLQSARRV
ncbi:hypothetical protein AAG570_007329 [Ranatra chinensis]|uniref:Uncharacterized protein n=1 Tax=Ranatra chinensis TaxID=642074 RepID=A0ABD0XVV7_9HEMI